MLRRDAESIRTDGWAAAASLGSFRQLPQESEAVHIRQCTPESSCHDLHSRSSDGNALFGFSVLC